jgi:small subunit ribosomal protein S16
MKMTGRKHQPFFRICVIDRQKSRDGLPIEEVGTYDPMVKNKAERVKINLDRVNYWISVGATPSDRVATLLKKLKNNDFGTARPAPDRAKPKELPAEAAAPSEGEGAPAEDEAAS